ncbi:MAG: response regulator [Candidatus Omnitrophota bacterium]
MKTILIIDDNQDFRDMVQYILKNEGYNVLAAADGKQGVLEARKEIPDLILMDVMMPGHGGQETAWYFKAIGKFSDIPIVFLTGVVSEDKPEGGNSITIEGNEYPMISKSVGKTELLRRINELLLKNDKSVLRVLVVEDSATDAHFIARSLEKSKRGPIKTQKAATLQEANKCLEESFFDVIVLDLGLPDSPKTNTLLWMIKQELPVIVITGDEDDATIGEAFRHGAQDYLVKGDFSDREIIRCVLFSIERNKFKNELYFYKKNIERIVQDRIKEHHRT